MQERVQRVGGQEGAGEGLTGNGFVGQPVYDPLGPIDHQHDNMPVCDPMCGPCVAHEWPMCGP